MLTFPDQDQLLKIARESKEKYKNADPYPHIVFDDFFDSEMLSQVLEEFPGPDDIKWRKFQNSFERKLASRGENQFGPRTKQFAHYLNSATFLSFLEKLTGINAIISDPFFDGGGLHQIQPGGVLKIHADFNKDSRTGLDRRLNVLIYLNQDWKEDYGGHFELWDKEMKNAKIRLAPIFNRMVIFSTTATSYHGHPDPLTCPSDRTRKSFAAYYYTNGRPEEEIREEHSTLFQMREGEKHLVENEQKRRARKQAWRTTKKVFKAFVPPIIYGNIE